MHTKPGSRPQFERTNSTLVMPYNGTATQAATSANAFAPPPPPPPAPSFAPPPPPPPATGHTLSFSSRTTQPQDPELRKILNGASDEILQQLKAYEKKLKDLRKAENNKIDAYKNLNESRKKECQDIDTCSKDTLEQINVLNNKLLLISQAKTIDPNKANEVSEILQQSVNTLKDELENLATKKASLLTEIAEDEEKIKAVESELNKQLKPKITAVEKALLPYQQSKKAVISKTQSGRSKYEDELCQAGTLFIYTRTIRDRTVVFTPEEILKLQIGLFDKSDWMDGDHEAILENKLRNAIIVGRNDVAGLGATPRENIKGILGYDIIEQHQIREREKREAAERQRLARAQRFAEEKRLADEAAKRHSEKSQSTPQKRIADTDIAELQEHSTNASPFKRERIVATTEHGNIDGTPRRDQLTKELKEKHKELEQLRQEKLAAEKLAREQEESKRLAEEQAKIALAAEKLANEKAKQELEAKQRAEESAKREQEARLRAEAELKVQQEQARVAALQHQSNLQQAATQAQKNKPTFAERTKSRGW